MQKWNDVTAQNKRRNEHVSRARLSISELGMYDGIEEDRDFF